MTDVSNAAAAVLDHDRLVLLHSTSTYLLPVEEANLRVIAAMWGSDQAGLMEPVAFIDPCRDVRMLEAALGDGVMRIMPGEESKIGSLRM